MATQTDPAVDARVARLVAQHGRGLMRIARRCSICDDDALDAYQRALEIYLRRVETLDPATEAAWMRVVVHHEALAVRRARGASLTIEEIDFDARPSEEQREVDDLLEGRERVDRSAEALRMLKRDEARALMLTAQGLSYREIASALDWTYTKVNRCVTEGRARFLRAYAAIEAGEQCDRFAPLLAALAGGTASADALVELRPHIRHCATCRATVRTLHQARLGRVAGWLPLPAVLAWVGVSGRGGLDAVGGGAADGVGGHVTEGLERMPGLGGRDGLGGSEPPLPPDWRPVDVPDLEAAMRAWDGAAGEPVVDTSGRLLELKAQVYAWAHRLSGSDLGTSAQLAASAGGGGRIATVGAIVGLCLSGVGAGTVCVVTGVIDNPLGVRAPVDERRSERTRAVPAPRILKTRPIATPAPPPPAVSRRPAREPQPLAERKTPVRRARTTSRSHEQAPIAPAPRGATQDFSLEQSAPAASAAPAAAPPIGGGEFAP